MGEYELGAHKIGEGVGPQFLGNLARVGSRRWTIDLKFEAFFFFFKAWWWGGVRGRAGHSQKKLKQNFKCAFNVRTQTCIAYNLPSYTSVRDT